MSERACYVERGDGGATLTGLRIIGANADDRWTPDPADEPAIRAARAAAWIAERLRASGSAPLDALVLDAGAAMCSWISVPTDDPTVVAAACEQSEMLPILDRDEGLAGPASAATVQVLVEPGTLAAARSGAATSRRLAAFADRDVLARLLIDGLDERAIRIGRASSLLHEIARAWDPASPAAPSAERASERIVATNVPMCAVVVADPAGRLLWSWSSSGALEACGSMLVGSGVRPEHISRLAMDWLAWAAQLGRCPARLVCVGKLDEGLTLAELGHALARTWGGATVDAVEDDDPIGTTLRRCVAAPASIDDPRTGLVRLSNRPGRVHRAMWRWGAIAIAMLAALLGVVGWRWWLQAGTLRTAAATLDTTWHAEIAQAAPDLAASERPLAELRSKVDALRPKRLTGPVQRPQPILDELRIVSEQISGYELVRLTMGSGLALAPKITVRVTSTLDGEMLKQAFQRLDGSHVAWDGGFNSQYDRDDLVGFDLQGIWYPQEDEP